MSKSSKIVLTGPSCSGKTTLLEHLAARCPDDVRTVPEIATLILSESSGRALPSHFTPTEMREFQLDIYHRQLLEESRVDGEKRIVILDRGTVDGAAYWPGGAGEFWIQIATSSERELNRYSHVIWLDSVVDLDECDMPLTSEYRKDSAEEIAMRGEKLFECWEDHPSFWRIPACHDFDQKVTECERLVARLASPFCCCLSK